MGAAVGRAAERLGAERGPADPDLRGRTAPCQPGARAAGARHRLRRRHVPAPGRRPRRARVRTRRISNPARSRAHAPARGRAAARRHGSAPLRGRHLRPRDRLQLVLLRQRHRRRAARGRPRREARRAGRDPGVGIARAKRPGGDEADRQAIHATPAGGRTDRARLLGARCARGPRHTGRAHARERVRHNVGLRISRRGHAPSSADRACWSAPTARRSSRTRSSRDWRLTALPKGATGSTTSSTI